MERGLLSPQEEVEAHRGGQCLGREGERASVEEKYKGKTTHKY